MNGSVLQQRRERWWVARSVGALSLALAMSVGCTNEAEPEARPIADSQGSDANPGDAPASGVATSNELLLKGTIAVDEGLEVPEDATLFVMGRGSEGRGPPVLVKRIHPVKLPLEFSLTGADQMMKGVPVPNSFVLSARLDQDGDAISKTPGDLTGELETVERGASDVKLTLTEAIGEAKPSTPVQAE
ncbi:MAG: hypothetical protein AAF219_06435 [Myxococcota bacterium]